MKIYKLNEFVSYFDISKIYNEPPILIPTVCTNYISNFKFRVLHKSNYDDIVTDNLVSIHKLIFDYINILYNIKYIARPNDEIDHISGNVYNNLYIPHNSYYNNIRVCTNRQNQLNKPKLGYQTYCTKSGIYYIAKIRIENGKRKYKSFLSPQECIDWNISQLSDEDKSFYYHSPTNPRNWSWTFSNTILNAIGYNDLYDEYDYNDEDFCDDW